MNVDEF
jgi:hypothetical protein